MKHCPQCKRLESDDTLRFCRVDGKALVIDEVEIADTVKFPIVNPTEQDDSAEELVFHPSVAVLSFANLSADVENEYFCDGLAEELLNSLSRLEGLRVASRTSAFSYKNKNYRVDEIARALNVNTILEGSVRQAGDRLRISVQLIDAAEGYQLWSERYDRQMKDIFEIQDEIALAVIAALKVKLLGDEKAGLLNRYRVNTEAYNLYLKGRYYWNQRPRSDAIKKGIQHFQKAIEKDPDFSLAYAGLADAYAAQGAWENSSEPPHNVMPMAKAAARKALELDDNLSEAHTSLAYATLHYDWDLTIVEEECKRAIELNPNYAIARHWYSHYLIVAGRVEESLAESIKCLELEPLDLILNQHMAWHYVFARQYDEAILQCERTNELAPNFFWVSFFSALAFEQKGMLGEAIAAFEKAVLLGDSVSFAVAGLGHAYALSGKKGEARTRLNELILRSQKSFVTSYDLAVLYAGLGENDQAFEWLEKAFAEHSGWMVYLGVEPRMDVLRNDPRFQDLLHRVGLTKYSNTLLLPVVGDRVSS